MNLLGGEALERRVIGAIMGGLLTSERSVARYGRCRFKCQIRRQEMKTSIDARNSIGFWICIYWEQLWRKRTS
jgi:hypothetical protein